MATAKQYQLQWSEIDREPSDGFVEGPLWDDVRAIVEHLARGGAQGFVILSRGDETFIQTAAVKGGLIVEHHRGGEHYALADAPTDGPTAVSLFRAWFDDPRAIDEHGDWEPM